MANVRFDVFLCHNSTDREDVEYIDGRLRATGLKTFLDTWNLIPGEPLIAQVEEALAQSEAVAVFIGSSGRSPWQNLEINTILNERATSGGRVIPVLLPGADPDDAPTLLKSYLWVQFRTRDDEQALHLLSSGIRGVAPGAGPAEIQEKLIQPYRGLQYFDVADSALFAGRTDLTTRAMGKINATFANGDKPRFLAVVGASGSGKSSLARAGIIASMLEADPRLCYGIMVPGQYPLESLAVAMLKACGKPFDGQDLASRAAGYRDNHRLLTQDAISALAIGNGHSRFVLLIDQFEQLFASGAAHADRDAVIENICVMAADHSVQAGVLITIRDDFIGECARNPTLAQLLEQQILITPLNKDELRQVIEEPARAAGARVEPELTRTLIRDCEGEANALPLLEFVLYKLWDSAGGALVLSYQRYEQLGGLVGALNSHADSIYTGLNTQALQDAARRIFLALIQPFQNARFARQSRFVGELLPSTGDAEGVRTTERALGVLAGERARLVTIRGSPGPGGESGRLVELSHEILIQCWDRLRSWLNADREFLLWKERLRVSVNDWRAHPNDAGVYLQGMLLDQAVNWLKQRPDEHSSEERQYIDSCRAKRDAARRRRLATIAAQAAGVLVLIAIIIWLPTRYSKQRLLANTRATIASDNDASLVLALHALSKYPGYETEALLQEAVQTRSTPVQIGFPGAIEELTFLPDSRRVAVLLPGLAPRVCPSGSKGSCVSYGADKPWSRVAGSNTQLFAGGSDGTLHLWALDSREALPGPPPVPGKITAVAVPESGSNLLYASSGEGNIIYRWGQDIQAPSMVATLPEKINDIALPEKGSRFAAVGNDGGVFLFNSLTEPPKRLTNPSGIAGHVVMTADGQKITTIPQVGSLYAWLFSSESGSPVGPLSGLAQGGGMSRDGTRFFVINRDSKGRLSISIRDGVRLAELYTFALPPEPVTGAVMSPDGKRIATAVTLPGNEGAIRVYELDPAELAAVAKEVIANKDQPSLLAACRQHLDADTCAKYIGETK